MRAPAIPMFSAWFFGGYCMEWINQNLPYLMAGISVGGQYALIAIGYTMVYGILRLINFAHGDIFMVAGLIMVYAMTVMPIYVAIPLMIVLTVLLGFTVERVAYKPLRSAPRMSIMISAIGVSYLLQNLALYVTGGLSQQYPAIPWLSDTISVFGATTKRVTVITPVLTIVLVLALVALIKYTKIGMAMRAASRDFETSQLMGIKINSVISMTFIIGSFLAAIGSMLFFTNYTGVTPTAGAMPGLKAFVAAVFGGIGSIPGAVIGAFIIGICQGVATLPGLSRSGTTITACVLNGLDRRFAVKYSFIMSIPAILGAMVLQLKDIGSEALMRTDLIHYAIGMAVAAVVGYICIKTMLVIVKKRKFKFFSIYCLIVGIVSIIGYFVTT